MINTLCPSSKTTAVAPHHTHILTRLWPAQLSGFDWVYSTTYTFAFVAQASSLTRQWLVTPITDLPLLNWWAYLVWWVGDVACMVHCWIRLLITVFSMLPALRNSWTASLKKRLCISMCVSCVCACHVCVHVTCVCMPRTARRRCQIFWRWSYRQLRSARNWTWAI